MRQFKVFINSDDAPDKFHLVWADAFEDLSGVLEFLVYDEEGNPERSVACFKEWAIVLEIDMNL